MLAVDVERHVDPAFAGLRVQHPLLPTPPIPTEPDSVMRACMDLEDNERRWRVLVDYLIKYTAMRRRMLDEM